MRSRWYHPRALTLGLLTLLLVAVAGPGQRGSRRVWAASRQNPATVFQQQLDAYNRGDLDAVLQTFTDTAVLVGAPGCSLTLPCLGKGAIAQSEAAAIAGHASVTLLSQSAAGSTITGQLEARSDAIRAAGSERALYAYLVQVQDGRVAAFVGLPDLSDSQTLQFLATQ